MWVDVLLAGRILTCWLQQYLSEQVSMISWGVRVSVSVIFMHDDFVMERDHYNFVYR